MLDVAVRVGVGGVLAVLLIVIIVVVGSISLFLLFKKTCMLLVICWFMYNQCACVI